MKKLFVVIIVALVAVVVLGATGLAYAQSQTPQPTAQPGGTYGPGMMGGARRGGMGGWGGMMGGFGSTTGGNYGPMHQYMIDALAKGLGMTSADLQARIDKGETPYQVAQAKGLTADQIKDLFLKAHDEALDNAVDAGLLTQAQADWMDQRHEQMWQNGVPGTGCGMMGGTGTGGRRGPGGMWGGQRNTPPAQSSQPGL